MKPIHLAKGMQLDLDELIRTRLMIQGVSGAGKSELARLMIEQAAKQLQVIVLDPESEYSSLRETNDFLLAGREGEVPATVKSSAVLALQVLEMQVSTIIDIYDLKVPDRRAFVKGFLNAIMAAPKKLHHEMLVVIDEAHNYCPERGAGEAESLEAVISLMSQGRKRGFCGILLTQRLSKLHKDAAAECNNVCIGRTFLDLDQRRAGDVLGMTDKSARLDLRFLEPGEWWSVGPAFRPPQVTRWRADRARSARPSKGSKAAAPAAPKVIQALIPKLREALEDPTAGVYDLESAQARIRSLEHELKRAQQGKADPGQAARIAELEQNGRYLERQLKLKSVEVDKAFSQMRSKLRSAVNAIETAKLRVEDAAGIHENLGREAEAPVAPATLSSPAPSTPRPTPPIPVRLGSPSAVVEGAPNNSERKLLNVLAQYPDGRTKNQLAILSNYSSSGGGFNNLISALRTKGWAVGTPANLQITSAGLEALGPVEPLPNGDELAEYWYQKLSDSQGKILKALIDVYPDGLTPQEIADVTSFVASGGGFNNNLSKLRTLELISGRGKSKHYASEGFFQ